MTTHTGPGNQDEDSDSRSDATPMTAAGQVQPDRVYCAACFRDVPLSEAFVPEAVDYVIYFCGLSCYEDWPGQAESK